ncbi:glutathione S-transferase [Plasticicumulans acidivorans]|uniref:Glutathione S-transferase n=2 Tax=Plasticicumulans acidivorans TaxID=886464 RepID=A0A317MSN4_9GAMM|nr:glutathione S-transferase [Plasticicumulans acidivorans]
MSAMTLVIGNKNYSSWSLRPWLLLRQLGLSFDELRLPLDTAEFDERIKALSPSGRVPVLQHAGRVIWDSLAIIEYVNDVLAPGRAWPQEAGSRAQARCYAAEMHSGFFALRNEMPMNIRARRRVQPSADCLADIARIQALWTDARSAHAADGPWLFGEFCAADAMFAPVVLRLRTYGVALSPPLAAYCDTLIGCAPMQAWIAAALQETEILSADEAGEER